MCNLIQIKKRNIFLTSFQPAYIGKMNTSEFSKLFLRKISFFSQIPYTLADSFQY